MRLRWVIALVACAGFSLSAAADEPQPLSLIVMDPLAAPLSCDCVKGFAQRNYEKLAEHLQERLGRPVRLAFAESIQAALRGDARGKVDLVIGKDSVVRFDARERKLTLRPLAMLTDKQGGTTLAGLFVVPKGDAAQRLEDLKGYRILFGPADSDEKHAAALAALRKAGIEPPQKPETRPGCSDGVLDMLESHDKPGTAAVISAYAAALLEGCGTIEKGAIRVIGRAESVPFVTAFANKTVSDEEGRRILQALLAVRESEDLLAALETKDGFVEIPAAGKEGAKDKERSKEKPPAAQDPDASWPGWRGPNRDGLVPWLPDALPDPPRIVWRQRLSGPGLSGVAATAKHVLVADRDPADLLDIFRCLAPDTGAELWKLEYAAPGELDYGNSPRATPLVYEGRVFLLGAHGDLHCVRLADGHVIWKRNLRTEFGTKSTSWGYCSSPLIVDGRLVVNPGAAEASVAALDPADGKTLWKTPGGAVAYSSFIAGRFGGVRQIVGYDADSLGGWDAATGKRLWRLVPPERGDFNVPTPIDLGGRLLVTTENNGTRLYEFDAQGKIIPKPAATNKALAPDSSTPVVVGTRVFGCWQGLYCLDAGAGLAATWASEDRAFDGYASLVASPTRVLVTTAAGELVLLDARGPEFKVLSRQRPFGEECEILSHPAVAGRRLYLRSDACVACLGLEQVPR